MDDWAVDLNFGVDLVDFFNVPLVVQEDLDRERMYIVGEHVFSHVFELFGQHFLLDEEEDSI